MAKVPKSLCILAIVSVTGCGVNIQTHTSEWGLSQKPGVLYRLPLAVYTLTLTQTEKCEVKLKISETPKYFPDESAGDLFLTYNNDPVFSNNTMDIQVDQNGLLKSINGTSESKTTDVIAQAFALARQAVAAGPPEVTSKPEEKCAPTNLDAPIWVARRGIDGSLASGLESQVAAINELLEPAKVSLSAGYSKTTLAAIEGAPIAKRCKEQINTKLGEQGICARYNKTFTLGFTLRRTNGSANSSILVDLMGPDPTSTYLIPLKDKTFAKFDVTLDFASGILTKVKSTDNSEALAAMGIPAAVVAGILGLETPASNTSASPSKR